MSPRRLLVIDDEPETALLLAQVGSKAGFESRCACDYESFEREYDDDLTVISIDLVMPVDGVEVLRFLSERHCRAAIILVSSVDDRVRRSAEQLARERGLHLVGGLNKPLDVAAFERLLLSIDGTPRSEKVAPVEVSVAELRRGIEAGELEVYYQPKVDLASREVCGVEAVVRWHHDTLGTLDTETFVGLAEREGLSDPLTESVVEQAFAQSARWSSLGLGVAIAVNISAKCLGRLGLPERIGRHATEQGVDPGQIILEITETALQSDQAAVLDVATRLRMQGFGLALDDFGIGYANLERLRHVPFTELKLDRSYVAAALEDREARKILMSSLSLGHSLGLIVTAEGIETALHCALLRDLGCDHGQGYYISHALPGDAVADWVSHWRGLADWPAHGDTFEPASRSQHSP